MTKIEIPVLFICWRDPLGGGIYPVGKLSKDTSEVPFEFRYLKGALEARNHGFEPFLSFLSLGFAYRATVLFPFFHNLLMSEKRSDYPEYIRRLALDAPEGFPADPFTVISRDRGGGASEKLEVFGMPNLDKKTGELAYFFLARGVQHVEGAEEAIRELNEGEALNLVPEPKNPKDPLARMLKSRAEKSVGYIPYYLTEELQALHDAGSHPVIVAEKINLPPAPVHHRLLCKMSVMPSKGFEPFSGERFEPILPADIESDSAALPAGRPRP